MGGTARADDEGDAHDTEARPPPPRTTAPHDAPLVGTVIGGHL